MIAHELLPVYGAGIANIEAAAAAADEHVNHFMMRAVRLGNFLAEYALETRDEVEGARLHLIDSGESRIYCIQPNEMSEPDMNDIEEADTVDDLESMLYDEDEVMTVAVPMLLMDQARLLAEAHRTDESLIVCSGLFFRQELIALQKNNGTPYLQHRPSDSLTQLPSGLYRI